MYALCVMPPSPPSMFRTLTSPGQVVKVNLATFTPTGNITLSTGENSLTSAVIDSTGTNAYFG